MDGIGWLLENQTTQPPNTIKSKKQRGSHFVTGIRNSEHMIGVGENVDNNKQIVKLWLIH